MKAQRLEPKILAVHKTDNCVDCYTTIGNILMDNKDCTQYKVMRVYDSVAQDFYAVKIQELDMSENVPKDMIDCTF